MKSRIKNIIAVIVGVFAGGLINMAIIMVSGKIIPPPVGTNLTTEAGLKAAMPLMEPKHFLMPFIAHALHAFIGSIIACKIAASNQMRLAMIVGGVVFLGGAMNIFMLPSPMWFNVIDLFLAYFPMAYLGARLVRKN